MFQLITDPSPTWLTVADGIRVLLKPAGTEGLLAARREVRAAVRTDPDVDTNIPFVFGFVAWGAEDWEGIGGGDGKALAFSTEGVAALLRQRPDIYQFLDDHYVGPVLEMLTEKKRSSPSPNGSSAAAPPIAKPAPKGRRTKATAPSAPTESTNPAP